MPTTKRPRKPQGPPSLSATSWSWTRKGKAWEIKRTVRTTWRVTDQAEIARPLAQLELRLGES